MRHLRSILYALVLAPAAWILCGVGFDQDLTGRARDNTGPESVGGLLLLLLAGAAYAILLFAPISPAGPLIAGLAYLGIGIWARAAPEAYAGIWPADITKEGFNISTPGYGLTLLLAAPLLCTALSARRWAGYEPPQVVFIGTLGRARGAAAAPGTTLAAEPTTAFDAGAGEKTTLLSALFPDAVPPSSSSPSSSSSSSSSAEGPTHDIARSEEVTTVISAPVGDPGEKTQVIRPVPAASAAAPASEAPSGSGGETTKAMTISGSERPDPGQDPTTRLTPVPPASPAVVPLAPAVPSASSAVPSASSPGEATTRATKATTVANLERPADEAADDTRPLALPAPRPPADDEATRRL